MNLRKIYAASPISYADYNIYAKTSDIVGNSFETHYRRLIYIRSVMIANGDLINEQLSILNEY